ncbi:MAG: hypothetical protein MI924_22480, partial [Chloroflexales bacterium]|nr:hypothetical protein [Chloroflexales bacterium]
MTQPEMTVEEKRIRLFIYEFVVRFDRCPTLNEIAEEAQLTPMAAEQVLQRLESVHAASCFHPGRPTCGSLTPLQLFLPRIGRSLAHTAGSVCACGMRWVFWWSLESTVMCRASVLHQVSSLNCGLRTAF